MDTNQINIGINALFVPLIVRRKKKVLDPFVYDNYDFIITNETKDITIAIVPLRASPHFIAATGDMSRYKTYAEFAGKLAGFGIKYSITKMEALFESMRCYHYTCQTNSIKVQIFDDDYHVIRDGVHRAAFAATKNNNRLLVNLIDSNDTSWQTIYISNTKSLAKLKDTTDDLKDINHKNIYLKPTENKKLKRQIAKGYYSLFNDTFTENKVPVLIHKSMPLYLKTYPNYENKDVFDDNNYGINRWDYIIERNLPSLVNKTILELGCNNGLYSYMMKKYGALVVHGLDRNENIKDWSSKHPIQQNVVNQAYFTCNLLIYKDLEEEIEMNGLEFFDVDISEIDFRQMKYDLVVACNILHNFGEKMGNILQKICACCEQIFIQTDLKCSKKVRKYASIENIIDMLKTYGFRPEIIDEPSGYRYPIIYAVKKYETIKAHGTTLEDNLTLHDLNEIEELYDAGYLEEPSDDSDAEFTPKFSRNGRCKYCGKHRDSCSCTKKFNKRRKKRRALRQRRRELWEFVQKGGGITRYMETIKYKRDMLFEQQQIDKELDKYKKHGPNKNQMKYRELMQQMVEEHVNDNNYKTKEINQEQRMRAKKLNGKGELITHSGQEKLIQGDSNQKARFERYYAIDEETGESYYVRPSNYDENYKINSYDENTLRHNRREVDIITNKIRGTLPRPH